ncbi:hypothetical protein I2W78_07780 [Streptomyces spinoverrucosus]|uniref:hypothetical protein n=1 Tax=Streptomyces spinoverrucosus TaxID=284043 RepID=UPI0018C38C54|nr:hypothetical protein [Streptomyces spinoverrucosus]MBG0851745.1 hypothetical protein [Streptomyces spinoverrucosus]
MDIKNPVESPVTFNLHRAEYLIAFAVTIVLILVHFQDIRWIPAIALFLYIDVIGYIPGAIAYRRSPDGRIHKAYYVLYNSMHSLISVAAVGVLWWWLVGAEWALLALPFHVFGDRGVFGNFLKPFGLPFEPVSTPLVDQVTAMLRRRGATTGRVPLPLSEDSGEPVVGASR